MVLGVRKASMNKTGALGRDSEKWRTPKRRVKYVPGTSLAGRFDLPQHCWLIRKVTMKGDEGALCRHQAFGLRQGMNCEALTQISHTPVVPCQCDFMTQPFSGQYTQSIPFNLIRLMCLSWMTNIQEGLVKAFGQVA